MYNMWRYVILPILYTAVVIPCLIIEGDAINAEGALWAYNLTAYLYWTTTYMLFMVGLMRPKDNFGWHAWIQLCCMCCYFFLFFWSVLALERLVNKDRYDFYVNNYLLTLILFFGQSGCTVSIIVIIGVVGCWMIRKR